MRGEINHIILAPHFSVSFLSLLCSIGVRNSINLHFRHTMKLAQFSTSFADFFRFGRHHQRVKAYCELNTRSSKLLWSFIKIFKYMYFTSYSRYFWFLAKILINYKIRMRFQKKTKSNCKMLLTSKPRSISSFINSSIQCSTSLMCYISWSIKKIYKERKSKI